MNQQASSASIVNQDLAPNSLPLTDIETIVNSQSVETLWEYFSARLAGLGFTRVIYGFTQFKLSNSLGDPRDLMVLTNYPSEFVEKYIDGRMFFDGPMVRWASENVGAMSWGLTAERAQKGELSKSEQQVVELHAKFDLSAGYTISFSDFSARSKAGIGMALDPGKPQSEADDIWKIYGRQIEALCNIAHLRINTLPFISKDRKLTDRQRETLEWVGEGKTTQDIATIMGLTPATVEKHLRRAREVLDVDTTAQAVLKASFYNQIYVL